VKLKPAKAKPPVKLAVYLPVTGLAKDTGDLQSWWNCQYQWRFAGHVGLTEQSRHCMWRFAEYPMQFTYKRTPPR